MDPLNGMPRTCLNLYGCNRVRDLEPLRGIPLKVLQFVGTNVTDLIPLQGMELEEVRLTPQNITQGLPILRDMKSLKSISNRPRNQAWSAAEFWERYDKGEFTK
jgi:hypothetical protein